MLETAKQTTEFYDEEAASYDNSRYSTKGGIRVDRFHKSVLNTLLPEETLAHATVLDLGCGTGRLLPFMSGRCSKVTGIDGSQGMLDRARNAVRLNELANVTLANGSIVDLPFRDQEFDVIYSILVLNLIPDYQRVLAEVRRVLKTGGTFVFSLPNLDSVYYPAGQIVNRRQRTFGSNRSGHRYSHWFGYREINDALNESGLRLECLVGQPMWTRWWNDVRPVPGTLLGRMFSKSIYIRARKS